MFAARPQRRFWTRWGTLRARRFGEKRWPPRRSRRQACAWRVRAWRGDTSRIAQRGVSGEHRLTLNSPARAQDHSHHGRGQDAVRDAVPRSARLHLRGPAGRRVRLLGRATQPVLSQRPRNQNAVAVAPSTCPRRAMGGTPTAVSPSVGAFLIPSTPPGRAYRARSHAIHNAGADAAAGAAARRLHYRCHQLQAPDPGGARAHRHRSGAGAARWQRARGP